MIQKLIILAGFLASALHLQSQESNDLDVITAVLMGEGRSEGESGMVAIAQVIRNRGGSPIKVVTAYRQFSCLNVQSVWRFVRKMKREPEWPKAHAIATILMHNPALLGDSARSANHYETVGKTPFWTVGLKPVATIGRLNFYICK